MNIFKSTIKELNESYSPGDDFGAWFVALRGNEIIDISDDSGGGHHAGYLWATSSEENAKSIGLEQNNIKLVRDYFTGGTDDWVEREDADHYIGGNLVVRPNHNEFIKAIQPIYKNYFRVIYQQDNGNILLFTIGKPDKETHHSVMQFIIDFSKGKDISTIYVDTYDDRAVWTGASVEEAAETDEFSDIIEDRWKSYSNYFYR